jgi:long-subunit fatty acid transport protein
MNELAISLGANYGNKLFMGMTLGFPIVNYSEEAIHIETDEADTIPYFQSFQLEEAFHSSGTGFNIKLGVILRPNKWIRIGGAFHSPTFLNLSDEYSSSISSVFDSVPQWSNSGSTQYLASSPEGQFDYRITTPLRLMGSMAFIFRKHGLVSLDYEWLDYAMANLTSDIYGFSHENAAINQKYGTASNLRAGAEWRVLPFSLRAGFGLQGSPFSTGNLKPKTTYSFGMGIREKIFYIDFAYVYTKSDENYYLYNPALIAASSNSHTNHQIQSTIGFRF